VLKNKKIFKNQYFYLTDNHEGGGDRGGSLTAEGKKGLMLRKMTAPMNDNTGTEIQARIQEGKKMIHHLSLQAMSKLWVH
jgi:hypothetical protein